MPRNWTPAQSAAINAREADLLVAAAAGSGKTAVLVERIIQRITDKTQPVDLDRLLVVTFTNAAAAEMRQRISSALSMRLEQEPENELLLRQMTLLPRASITTMHAFCHKILRANFNLLDLDPSFRLADPTENELLRLSALEEVIEELYEDPLYAEDFLSLTEAYMNIKSTDRFYALINHIYDYVMSLPDPAGWLCQAAEQFAPGGLAGFENAAFMPVLLAAGKRRVETILRKYDSLISMADNDDGGESFAAFLQVEQKRLSGFLELSTYEAFYLELEQFAFEKIPNAPKDAKPVYRDSIRKMRDGIKNQDMKKLQELFSLPAEEQTEILEKLYPVMRCLSEVVNRLRLRFDEKKNEKNLLNYNDLEHGCYRLFTDDGGKPTPLADSTKEQYDEILIDEYQDTSALQEAIFNAIKKEGGLFLVGDVKQSIYRFRNTNPLLFREKKERYREEENAPQRKIILSKNFRSRAGVLDAINYLCMRLMSAEVGEIEYNEEEMLYPGAEYPEMAHPLSEETELCLIETGEQTEEGEELENAEAEAVFVAQKIQSLIDGGYQVLGKDGPRAIRYRDICILMRSTGAADCFVKTMAAFGIPCYSDAGGSFLESEEITVMLSLLKIIDNPHQDIPLLAVLRSQLYALSPDDLAEIRLTDRQSDLYDALVKRAQQADELGKRLSAFLEALSSYREKSRQMGTAELVWHLYMQTGFYEAQATLPGGALRRLNLRLLYTRAAAFEKTGLKGLYSFIRFIDEYRAMGGDYDAARSIGEEQNVVRIMSIHKSKGLEFPVVILAGLGRKFYTKDLQEKVLIHSELGYGPLYVDTDTGLTYQNAARSAIREQIYMESLSEEMRILYVAMTRAREKLILLGSGKDLAAQLKKCAIAPINQQVSGAVALLADSYLHWIFMALLPHPDAELLRNLGEVTIQKPVQASGCFAVSLVGAETLVMPEPEMQQETEGVEEERLGALLPLLQSNYAYQSETELPAKVTVTEVKRSLTETEPDAVYLYPRPEFLKPHKTKLSAAEAGTAMHTVLERLDYQKCSSVPEISSQLADMVAAGVLTEEEKMAASAEKLFIFMQSDIGKRLQRAKQVLREVSFGIGAEAKELLHKEGTVMLQGMIDCVLFEEEGISILDYKTDKGPSPNAIAERYKIQLDCYEKAAEVLYGQKIRHRYLYLFAYDICLDV